ncbi:ATP-binding cassette domain-containing protein [Komagataeibacter rhaeticus]|nr:ATP-binding cassette domain-containing protein [Komagataeibacter rhaeticus]
MARLATFQRVMDRARAMRDEVKALPALAGADMVADGLDVFRPDGTPLLRGVNLTLPHGRMTVVTGPSGTGKSTLFRVLAGIWPFATGSITMPDAPMMFIPSAPTCPPVRCIAP